MINKISSSDLGLKNTPSKNAVNKNTLISTPITVNQPKVSYSLSNLQANYLPAKGTALVSFHGAEPPKSLPDVNTTKDLSDGFDTKIIRSIMVSQLPSDSSFSLISMPENEKILGVYHEKLVNDLSILLSSDKDAMLVMEEGVSPEIFAQSFANKVYAGKFDKIGFQTKTADVVYIRDPIAFTIREVTEDKIYNMSDNQVIGLRGKKIKMVCPPEEMENPGNFLDRLNYLDMQSARQQRHKVVFVQDFNKIMANLDHFHTGKNLKEFMAEKYPNLSIVGLIEKKSMEVPRQGRLVSQRDIMSARNVLNGMESIPKLVLPGLNMQEAEEFLDKNPKYTLAIFDKYPQAYLDMSQNAKKELITNAAKYSNEALPGSFYSLLDRVAAAKMSEAKDIRKLGVFNITTADVKRFSKNHSAVLSAADASEARFTMLDNVSTTLKDVGGLSQIREDIDDIISFLKNPKKYEGKPPKGFLMEGGPGTGKTLLARAIAGETSTPFFTASGSEFVEMYVGVGAARVRELFNKARKAAENSPNKSAIVFIDEFDALGKMREAGKSRGNDERESTLNQLLVEMDGIKNKDSDTRIIVLAATNRKDLLDPAILRPGRFDDSFNMPNPKTIADRLEILNIHARKLKFENEASKTKILDETAKMTEGMSGAEMASIMEKAQKVVSKRTDNKFITHNDVVEGFLRTIAGPINKVQDDVPMKELENTVRHEGGHAVIIDSLKHLLGEKISFITLDQRGHFLGAVFHHNSSKMTPDFRSVVMSAAVSYGGGMAEPDFNSIGAGAGVSGDLKNSTNLFRKAVTEWGLGVHTPPISMVADANEGGAFSETLMKMYSPKIEKDIDLFSSTSRTIAKLIVDFHRDFLDKYVETYKINAGKGGSNLSGEEFTKLRQQWLVETKNIKNEETLLKKIDLIINQAYNSNKKGLKKLFSRIV